MKRCHGTKRIELEEDLDDFDAEEFYNQICEQCRRRGYVDVAELGFGT